MNKKSSLLIENKSQLIQYLTDGIKKDNHLRIGVEHEKFIFNKDNFKRIDYDQIKNVFEILKNKGWEPQLEKNKLIGLKEKIKKLLPNLDFNMNYRVHLLKISTLFVLKTAITSTNSKKFLNQLI